jgi:hypothetical protein
MYELLVWDWDRESSYYVVERCNGYIPERLMRVAYQKANREDGVYVGAFVFLDGKAIGGYGFNPGYVPKPTGVVS